MTDPNASRPNEDALSQHAREILERAEREVHRSRVSVPTSRVALFPGLLLFLIDFRALVRGAMLSVFALGLTTIFQQFMHFMRGGMIDQFFAIALGMLMGPLVLVYLTAAAVCGLTILQDTAHGYDKVQQWPGRNFVDWMFDAIYVFNPLWLAALPGLLLGQVPFWLGVSGQRPALLLGVVSVWGLFPMLLLSVVESGSALNLWSQAIFRQFRAHRTLVKPLYLVSAGLVLGGLLAFHFLTRTWFPLRVLGAVGVNLAVWLYFRLLGRLAGLMGNPSDSAESATGARHSAPGS